MIINIYQYRHSYGSFTGLAGHELNELEASLCLEARMPKVLESSSCKSAKAIRCTLFRQSCTEHGQTHFDREKSSSCKYRRNVEVAHSGHRVCLHSPCTDSAER